MAEPEHFKPVLKVILCLHYLGLSRNLFEEEVFTSSSTDNCLHGEYNGSAKELVTKELEILAEQIGRIVALPM